MKQKILLIGLALFLGGVTQAQISKEAFEKAVDILNCKTVELTLPKENIQQYQIECPCNETNTLQIIKFLSSVGKLDATIALSNEVESLKKSFKENWKKEEVVSYLSESIFTDKKYQKIVAFSDKRKGKQVFDNYKSSLKSDISAVLEVNLPQVTSYPTDSDIIQSSFEDRIEELEINQKKKQVDNGILGDFAHYLILFSVLLGLIALILVLNIKKSNSNDPEVSSEIKNYVITKINDAKWNKSPQNNNVNSSDLKDAYKRITDLESEIRILKDKMYTSNTDNISVTKIMSQPNQEIKPPDLRLETFFLSSPNSDGSFDENSASLTYKEGATIYRFTKISNNKANFQIDEKEASIKLALQYRDKRIDPVCEATNAFNQAKLITTVQQGEAELQSGKWVVSKKAKIKYEN